MAYAERWTVGTLDFLELSIRVRAGEDDPELAQAAFETALRGRGLKFDAVQAPKTEQVMMYLAGIADPR